MTAENTTNSNYSGEATLQSSVGERKGAEETATAGSTESTEQDTTAQGSLSLADIKDSKGVSFENRWAELNRKVNKFMDSDISSKLDQVLNMVKTVNTPTQQGTYTTQTNQYTDQYDAEIEEAARRTYQRERERERTETIKRKHDLDFIEMTKKYPELDQNSDDYDPSFYKLADSIYQQLNLDKQESGAVEAIEYAAYKTGRARKNIEKDVLIDEKRRSRKLEEGAGQPNKKSASDDSSEPDPKFFQHFRVSSKKLKEAKKRLGGK